MRTVKAAAEHSGIPESLVRAVIRQIGDKESLKDVMNHGASGGFRGFTYYTDTVAFFKRQQGVIVSLVESMAKSLDENPLSMIEGFNCLKGERDLQASIGRCLYGGRLKDEDMNVANALSWFAAEEVARALFDE